MNRREHWESVYRSKRASEVSWYQAEAALSLRLIREVAPAPDTPIIDVGGGASVLASQLTASGYGELTVLDLSGKALAAARAGLGTVADDIRWIEGDILTAGLPDGGFGIWHDRAVFHFLTDPKDRARYAAQARGAVAPEGHLIVATFADDGPTRCSGLEVMRYSPAALRKEFEEGFAFLIAEREEHVTPAGMTQAFTYGLFKRTAEKGK